MPQPNKKLRGPHIYVPGYWIEREVARNLREMPAPEQKTAFMCSLFPDPVPEQWQTLYADSALEAATAYALSMLPRPRFVYVLYQDEPLGSVDPISIDIGDINPKFRRRPSLIQRPKRP